MTPKKSPSNPSHEGRRGLRITLACGAKFLYTLKGWPRSTYYCPKCGKTCRTKDFVEVGDPESMHALRRVLDNPELKVRKA